MPINATNPMLPVGTAAGVRIRPVDPADADGLAEFYACLSPESRYRRFMGTSRGLPPDASRLLCTPDHQHAEGLVAVLETPGPGDGLIVGHLCLVATGGDALELAVAVADAHQRHGIGRRLFVEALAWARRSQIRIITATAFADNRPALRLLESAPEGTTVRTSHGDVVSVEIPLRQPSESET